MKKSLALLLAFALLLGLCPALAEPALTPYEALSRLIGDKTFALTLRAEDIQGLEEYTAPFGGEAVCSLRREGDGILFTLDSAGEAYIHAAVDAAGYQVETSFIETGKVSGVWADLEATVTLEETDGEKALSLRISTPEHANIGFEFSLAGEDFTDYVVDAGFRLMNPDGTFWNIYDTVSASGGAAARESVISIVAPEWAIEGEGEETAEQAGNALTLSRRETYLVTLNDDDLGSLTFLSQLVISE